MESLPRNATAVFGGSFNPPGLHHRRLAVLLLDHFARVRVLPCGFRPDKESRGVPWMQADCRQPMIAATFAGLGNLELDWSDLDRERFTPTIELAERFRNLGELWFVVGADLFGGGQSGKSQIQTSWQAGAWIWQNLNWACLARPGYRLDPADLPPRHLMIACDVPGSSSAIRRALAENSAVADLVVPEVLILLGRC